MATACISHTPTTLHLRKLSPPASLLYLRRRSERDAHSLPPHIHCSWSAPARPSGFRAVERYSAEPRHLLRSRPQRCITDIYEAFKKYEGEGVRDLIPSRFLGEDRYILGPVDTSTSYDHLIAEHALAIQATHFNQVGPDSQASDIDPLRVQLVNQSLAC